jgi:ABC-type uncharacterized transport system auxiliary subunit
MKEVSAVVVVGALVIAGCGGVRYPATYLLSLPAPAPQQPQAVFGPVAVREFHCPEYLCEDRIAYRSGLEEIGFYEYHRWAANPRQAITQLMADSLRARSVFKSVASHERGIEASYVLTGKIERLEEVDQGRDVRAVCTISAQLMDAQTRSVVWNQTASETVPVEKRNVAGVVAGLSEAARTAVDRLVASMANELR